MRPLVGTACASLVLLAVLALALKPVSTHAQSVAPLPATALPSPRMLAETPRPLSLDDLIRLSLARHPLLAQAQADIQAAQGQVIQAGLYPNPLLNIGGEEMGSREGPGGIVTAPMITQQFLTPGKRGLSQAVAWREVKQADLALVRQRFLLLTAIRRSFFEVLVAGRRVQTLAELETLADQSLQMVQKLVEAQQAARIDLLQMDVELNRVRADLEAARLELAAAWRQLAATVGMPELPVSSLLGDLEAPLPDYQLDRDRAFVLANHPEVRWAAVGIERARLALQRARLEPIPNVSVGAGYTRNHIDRDDQWTFQVGVPLPVFNRNQGNILSAQAELSRAMRDVARVQNELALQLATAFSQYAAARARADRYRTSILPNARELYRITAVGYQAGQFDYLRVLQSQRAVQEANLEYVRALGEAWQAASEVAGLLLEEHWPQPAVVPAVEKQQP